MPAPEPMAEMLLILLQTPRAKMSRTNWLEVYWPETLMGSESEVWVGDDATDRADIENLSVSHKLPTAPKNSHTGIRQLQIMM